MLADEIQSYLRAHAGVARAIPRCREHDGRRDGLRRQRTRRIEMANIGISLPGTGEIPVAPVYVTGRRR